MERGYMTAMRCGYFDRIQECSWFIDPLNPDRIRKASVRIRIGNRKMTLPAGFK